VFLKRASVLILAVAAIPSAFAAGPRNILVNPATDRILPQLLVGGGWKTTITLVNLDTIPASFNLAFITPAGDLLALPVVGVGRTATFDQVTVAPNASFTIDTEDSDPNVSAGWAAFSSSGGKLAATAIVRQRVAGSPDLEVSLPFSSITETSVKVPFTNANGYSTLLVLVHPDVPPAPTATVLLVFRDPGGKVLSSGTIPLPPTQQLAGLATDFDPGLADATGTMEIVSSGRQFTALTLRLGPNASVAAVLPFAFTAAPPVQRPAAPPASLPGFSSSCAVLEGTLIFADDGQFLGKISANQYDNTSIANPYGPYGSAYSSTSIFNQYGQYGGAYSLLSPFNSFSSTPPVIFANSRAVAFLTVNTTKTPRIDTQFVRNCVGR
jgi:hypothetical protein